jgi:HEAT repeat protein
MTAERLPDVAEADLLQGLFDQHSSVRELCRYHLERLGVRNFRARYREALINGTGKNRRLAILGLGETGQSEDATELRSFLSDPEASVRKAAIRAITHLAGSTFVNELVNCLLDVSPGVSREARLAFQAHVAHIDVERLSNAFAAETRFHVRKEVLLLLFRLPTWRQIPFIFQACFDADEGVASIAQKHLRSWQKRAARSYASKDDLKALDEMLQRYGKQLGEGVVRELRFWIDSSK